MPLKPCRECGKEVATDARACPQCGAPAPTRPKSETDATRIFLVIILLAMLVLFALQATA